MWRRSPLLVLSLMSCGLTLVVQKHAVLVAGRMTRPMRLANALVSCAAYLCQFVLPRRLAVFYPYPEHLDWAAVLGAWRSLVSISWAAVVQRRRRPYLLVGWLWYLVMLLPVIGLVQVGFRRGPTDIRIWR